MTFELDQWGDHWDGYSKAALKVTRPETPSEATERERLWKIEATKHRQAKEDEARRQFEALKARFEP